RTFKVAAELRRSRSRAAVPTFLVGGTSGLVRQAPPSRRERRKATEAAAVLADDRPVWAHSLPAEPGEPAERKPGLARRMLRALGRHRREGNDEPPGWMDSQFAQRNGLPLRQAVALPFHSWPAPAGRPTTQGGFAACPPPLRSGGLLLAPGPLSQACRLQRRSDR